MSSGSPRLKPAFTAGPSWTDHHKDGMVRKEPSKHTTNYGMKFVPAKTKTQCLIGSVLYFQQEVASCDWANRLAPCYNIKNKKNSSSQTEGNIAFWRDLNIIFGLQVFFFSVDIKHDNFEGFQHNCLNANNPMKSDGLTGIFPLKSVARVWL